MQQKTSRVTLEWPQREQRKAHSVFWIFWTCFTIIAKVWYTDDVHGYFFSSKKMTMRKFWCAVHVLCKNPGVAGLYLEAETRQILESIYFCGFSFQFGEMHAFPFPLINEKHRVLCTQSVSLKPVDGQLVWSRVTVGLHSKTHLSAPFRHESYYA